MTDLKTEYDSMDTAARHLRTATSHLQQVGNPFPPCDGIRRCLRTSAGGCEGEAHRVGGHEAIGGARRGLDTEWGAEAKALTTVAEIS